MKRALDVCVFTSKKTGRKLEYLSFSPKKEKLPLIIHLHGAGGRGDSIAAMGHVGPIAEIENGRDIPAHFVAPHCYGNTWFELFETLVDFARTQAAREDVDKNRIYLSGVSMGGYAAWQLAMTCPEIFAALVPVCGGGMYWNAARLKDMPIWAFHGALDETVLPEESIKMVKAVNKAGGNARITICEHTKHNSWDDAYPCDAMWAWLFEQKK